MGIKRVHGHTLASVPRYAIRYKTRCTVTIENCVCIHFCGKCQRCDKFNLYI
jgi:hypothetical protein